MGPSPEQRCNDTANRDQARHETQGNADQHVPSVVAHTAILSINPLEHGEYRAVQANLRGCFGSKDHSVIRRAWVANQQ